MTADRGWVLRLPQTTPLSLNDRTHWRVKAKATKAVREAVAVLARHQQIPALDYARVVLAYQPRDKRRRDVDNLVPMSKACVDGLRDAGVLPDDDPTCVDHLMPRLLPAVSKDPAIWLVVAEALPCCP